MEHITDTFRVDTSIDNTWNTLLDIERIAPCMPGAQLQEIEGDEFRGIVKVKVGPITAQYKGAARLVLVDPVTRTIKIDASGRDTRGQGNASALLTVTMADDNGATVVDVDTELNVTGKVAQFGRGVMAEVSTKILKQFVENLERDVLSGEPSKAPATTATAGIRSVGASDAAPSTGGHTGAAAATAASPASAPVVRKVDMAAAKPVDLLDAAGGSVAKRALPLAGLLVFVLVILRARRRRNRT